MSHAAALADIFINKLEDYPDCTIGEGTYHDDGSYELYIHANGHEAVVVFKPVERDT